MKLTRAILSGAPSKAACGESHVGQAVVVERDAEAERRNEVAGAGTRQRQGRPLRRRIVNDDPARIETVLPPELEARDDRVGVTRRAGDEKAVLRQAQRHAVIEHDAGLLQEKAVADLARLQIGEAIIAVEVRKLGRVWSDDLDLAERGAVEQRDRIARPGRLALDRALGIVRAVPGRPQPAAVFPHLRAVGAVLRFERQPLQRADQRAAPTSGDDSHRHGDERRPVGRRPRLVDRSARQRGHGGEPVDARGLALVGRHAERRIALQVLDRDIAFARRERDVLQGHVVLEVDPSPSRRIRLRPCGRHAILTRRGVRRRALAAACGVTLPQGLVQREGAVRRPGDRDPLDFNLRHERGESLVVAQLALGLRVKMDRRRPAAGQQQRIDCPCLLRRSGRPRRPTRR